MLLAILVAGVLLLGTMKEAWLPLGSTAGKVGSQTDVQGRSRLEKVLPPPLPPPPAPPAPLPATACPCSLLSGLQASRATAVPPIWPQQRLSRQCRGSRHRWQSQS